MKADTNRLYKDVDFLTGVQPVMHFLNQPSLEKVLHIMQNDACPEVLGMSFPPSFELAGASDHRNYWKLGYQALMINNTSFMRNSNYHENPIP